MNRQPGGEGRGPISIYLYSPETRDTALYHDAVFIFVTGNRSANTALIVVIS